MSSCHWSLKRRLSEGSKIAKSELETKVHPKVCNHEEGLLLVESGRKIGKPIGWSAECLIAVTILTLHR